MNIIKNGCIVLVSLLLLSSCISNRRIVYLPNLQDTTLAVSHNEYVPKIQVGDILYISVSSLDNQSASFFSSSSILGVTSTISVANINPGIVVERDGTISLPKLGKINAANKTRKNLSMEIADSLKPYLKEPVVNIRFMNFRVTVLGAVNRPGFVTTSNERMNIFEAIGLAGDLSKDGNRKKVLILRDSADVVISKRLNLQDKKIFSSSYFFLQSNDILYVEPYEAKELSSTYTSTITVFNTALAFLLSALSIIVINKL